MASHSLITLSNTVATRLTPNGTHSGMDVTLQNVNNLGAIYVGVSDLVTSSDYGYRIMPGHAISFELSGKDSLYGISELDGLKLAMIEINLESQR
jgi:hypothetical protein